MEQRKLAAIMFTDIVDWGVLTQQNEGVALELLEEHNRLLRPLFSQHGGQVIKLTGDGFLVEFTSAVAAARCAGQIQKTLAERNASAPAGKKLQVRIGLHLGDVVHRGDDVVGDGVNIAARICPLAEPGAICISQQVYDQVRNQIEAPLVRLGRGQLKHVRVPVDIYRIVLPWEKPRRLFSDRLSFRLRHQGTRLLASVSVAALVLAGLALWENTRVPRGSRPIPAAPAPSLRARILDRRQIAVLPFDNLCPDRQKNEYFVDGTAEELTSQLQQIKRMRGVRDWRAARKYKGSSESPEEIGRDMNVGTVLVGSVRRAANTVRITAHLLDVQSQDELWSNHYDRVLKGPEVVIAIQSETAQEIAQALRVKVLPAEKQRIEKVPTRSLTAYDLYLQGRGRYYAGTEQGTRAAVDAFEEAVQIDPHYARAHAGIAEAAADMHLFLAPPPEVKQWGERARRQARRALELDPNLAEAHQAMAAVYYKTEWAWAPMMEECRRALALNPNLDQPHSFRAEAFAHLGLLEHIEPEVRLALERDPTSVRARGEALNVRGFAALYSANYPEAGRQMAEYERLFRVPNWKRGMAVFYQGEHERSEALLEEAVRSRSAPMAARCRAALASVLAASGKRKAAERQIATVIASPFNKDHHVANSLGAAYAQLGQRDEALRWLRQAANTGLPCYPWYARDPLLDPLRGDPQFQRFLEDVRRMTEAARKRYAP